MKRLIIFFLAVAPFCAMSQNSGVKTPPTKQRQEVKKTQEIQEDEFYAEVYWRKESGEIGIIRNLFNGRGDIEPMSTMEKAFSTLRGEGLVLISSYLDPRGEGEVHFLFELRK